MRIIAAAAISEARFCPTAFPVPRIFGRGGWAIIECLTKGKAEGGFLGGSGVGSGSRASRSPATRHIRAVLWRIDLFNAERRELAQRCGLW